MATTREKKKMCVGCRNNRYNMGVGFVERAGIDAPVTVDECWHLKSATIVKKRLVSISQVPPWRNVKSKYLSCFSMPGYFLTDKEC